MKKAWAHTAIGLAGALAIAWWFYRKQANDSRATGLDYNFIPGGLLQPPPTQVDLPRELFVDPIQKAISPIYSSEMAYAGMDGYGSAQDELMENAKQLMKQAQQMMESL